MADSLANSRQAGAETEVTSTVVHAVEARIAAFDRGELEVTYRELAVAIVDFVLVGKPFSDIAC